MSAIWGHIEFNNLKCTVESMTSEYRRKCKLDKMDEIHFKNAIIGCGIQFVNVEDEYEKMPYILDNGNTVMVSDCILDNREELISQLIIDFDNRKNDKIFSDGFLISKAYEKWSYNFVKHLRGIFSVAIFDSLSQQLFLCTDPTSSRCLYYFYDGNTCSFSTLISPIRILHPEIQKNDMYLKDYLLIPGLMPNISSSETPWENIYIIEAGCSVFISRSSCKVERYFSLTKRNVSKNIVDLKEEFIRVYNGAVKRAIRTNGEVGIALSGGFDSSSVSALAATVLDNRRKKLFSYTYVPHFDMTDHYPKECITDESEYVKKIVDMYPNIEAFFTDNDGKSFTGYIDELLDVLEIPFKAFVNLPVLLEIYRMAKEKNCKIFLNGQFGNSSVSYGDIDDAVYELMRKKKYFTAIKYFNNFCKLLGVSRKKAFLFEVKKLLEQRKNDYVQEELDEHFLNPFVNKNLLSEYSFKERNKSGMILTYKDMVLKSEDMKYELYTLPALSYIGAMETKLGLYTGIVLRDATRDVEVLEFCYSIPFEYFSYNGIPRFLIRGFMADKLPENIIYPISQTGIQSADWLYRLKECDKNVLKEMLENEEISKSDKYLNYREIKKFIEKNNSFVCENEANVSFYFIVEIFQKFMLF